MAFTLANARVITAEEIFWGGVEVNGDRIVRVFRGRAPERSDVIDCGGAYLSPGFVDIHVHGCCGAGFLTDDVEEIFRGTRMHALHGTTSIVPTTASSTMENVLTAVRTIARAMNERREGARILGAHMEGNYFNPKCAGAQNPAFLFGAKPENYMPMFETGVLRRVSASPEVDGVLDMARRLAPEGVLMSVGHSDAGYDDMMRALDAGFTHITHIYNAISMLSGCYYYPQVGACETALLHDEFTVEAICDGRHIPPQLLRLMYKIKGADRFHAVTDSVFAGAPDGPCEMCGMACLVEDDVCMLADRSAFAGSVATTDRLLRTLVFDAQIPLCDVVKMLTITPAREVGARDIGRLAAGWYADMNLFGDDLVLKKTWIGGREYT